LEEEAAKGWRLTSCRSWLATFTRVEPGHPRVRIQPQGPESRESWQERIDAYAAMGWDFAAVIDMDYEIYYCDDPAVPELDTDPVARSWAWEKPLDRSWRNGWLTLLGLALLMALPWLARRDLSPLETLLTLSPVQFYLLVILVPLMAVWTLWQLWKIRRIRRQLSAGLMPKTAGNWRKSHRRWNVIAVLLLLYWVLVSVGNLAWDRMMDETQKEEAPVVYAEMLGLDSGSSDWEIEHYRRCRGLLLPGYLELQWSEGDRQLTSVGYTAAFSTLTGSLYREKLAALRKQWPDAAETPVADDLFDEAALLTAEDETYFLACWGDRMLILSANFPMDLETHLEDIAAMLMR
jgi:hypothetical protein